MNCARVLILPCATLQIMRQLFDIPLLQSMVSGQKSMGFTGNAVKKRQLLSGRLLVFVNVLLMQSLHRSL
jgi:hypothetical protein